MSNYPTVTNLKKSQFGVKFGQSLTLIGDSLIRYEIAGDKKVKMIIEFTFATDIENWDQETKSIPEKLGGLAIASAVGEESQIMKNPTVQFLVDPDDIILQITAEPPPPSKGTHGG